MADTQPAKKAAAKKTATTKEPAAPTAQEVWDRLTAPFPQDWVERLPKVLRRDDNDKGRCEAGAWYSADGHACGGWHSRAVHLDYVGHAGITMRLNDVLGPGGWSFQPYAHGQEGLPLMGREFYASLTITVPGEDPVTKWDMAANYNGPQEALGDALRRCAMRFGIGTYLWAKSDHAHNLATQQEPPAPEPQVPPAQAPQPNQQAAPVMDETPVHVQTLYQVIGALTEPQKQGLAFWWDGHQERGELPPRAEMATVTPEQGAMVEAAVLAVSEGRDPDAQEAAQGPR